MNSHPLGKKELLNYALIAMPLSILGLPLYIYLPTYFAVEIGINMILVGSLLFIARLSDVFTDPYIGFLSDKSLKKYGSRKPIMIIGSFLLIISFYFLINPIMAYKSSSLLIFSVLVYFAWSMISIPYLTWSSEISDDYYHKTQLNSYREISTILGLILALVLPYLFNPTQIKDKLDILFILFISLFIPFFIITLQKVKIKNSNTSKSFTIKDIKNIYKTIPDLKNLQIGYFFNNLANAIPATIFLLFIESVIQQEEYSAQVLILYFLSGIIALPFWTLLSKRVGKKLVWISSIVLASSSFIFVIFLEQNDIILFAIISFFSGLSLGADIAFPTSIHGDIVQKIKTTQKDISGVLFGIWTMITKLALALSVAITFIILGVIGFDKESLNSNSILTITLLYGLVPILFKILSLYFISKYKDIEI